MPIPNKRLGQHFLTDGNVLRKISSVAGVKPGDAVLEIGPGKGALTEVLLKAGASVVAIEFDKNLATLLDEKFQPSTGLTVIRADALKVSFTELARERNCVFKSVSNLPYNISGPITAKFIEEREAFTTLTLMYQKEVALRLAATPGGRDYGVLSVLCQAYADVKMEFDVSRNSFSPPPEVSSTVVGIRFLEKPRVEIADEAAFKKVVRAAFGTRRKTLLNSLKSLGLDRGAILAALAGCGIVPARRGETLSVAEFAALAAALAAASAAGHKA